VLQSFPEPRPTTNPYLVLLRESIDATGAATVLTFSWRRALTASYDVFHVHWPEILVSGHSPLKKAVRQALFLLLLLRLRVTRTPLVRTLHNLELPSGISRRERVLLRLGERATSLWVLINEQTPAAPGRAWVRVLHGHYRPWFARFAGPVPSRPQRVAFVGLVRRYKGVDGLVQAFRGTADRAPLASLVVAGRPSSEELVAGLRSAADTDPRIELDLRFLSEDELVAHTSGAELVALPYREMHNSGSVLAALSLDRPVLVPDNEVNRALAAEVGPGWVHTYPGELTDEALLAAMEQAGQRPPGRPDLGRREWGPAGQAHVAAYRAAIAAYRSR